MAKYKKGDILTINSGDSLFHGAKFYIIKISKLYYKGYFINIDDNLSTKNLKGKKLHMNLTIAQIDKDSTFYKSIKDALNGL
jgi:hypothetical protein